MYPVANMTLDTGTQANLANIKFSMFQALYRAVPRCGLTAGGEALRTYMHTSTHYVQREGTDEAYIRMKAV